MKSKTCNPYKPLRNMYKPKESLRWRPKISKPVKLEELCLHAAVDLLLRTADRLKRNVREKKSIRDFISKNIPQSIQQRVIRQAVERLSGLPMTMNLLDLFEPGHVIRESLDLLGPFRMGFGAYEKEHRLTWSQGSAKKFNLNAQQLEQLYNLLIWSDPSRLVEFSISIARDTIKHSKLPNVLARARSLTRVTILSGAENHTLRILGINCPSLRYLDVSHSVRVTDVGIQSLFLKKVPRRKQTQAVPAPLVGIVPTLNASIRLSDYLGEEIERTETNPCAGTLVCLTLLGTSVTWDGCEYACKLMNFGYLHSFLPLVKIVRLGKEFLWNHGLSIGERLADHSPIEYLRDQVSECAKHALPVDDLNDIVMDHFKPICFQTRHGLRTDESKSLIFLRKTNSYMLSLHMRIDSSKITTLILPWYTFTWRLDNIMDLNCIGTNFPHLEFLRARIKGTWQYNNEVLLPHLKDAYVWSLNSATGLSILRNVPGVQHLELNNTQTLAINLDETEMTDKSVRESLTKNESLAESLKELTIRPSNLTVASLQFLTSNCPNLRRVGDLESWNITPEEIGNFNRHLDSVGSQCVLTVMNFPPSTRDKHEFL